MKISWMGRRAACHRRQVIVRWLRGLLRFGDLVPRLAGHAFDDRLSRNSFETGFDAFVEEVRKPFYVPRMDAPSLAQLDIVLLAWGWKILRAKGAAARGVRGGLLFGVDPKTLFKSKDLPDAKMAAVEVVDPQESGRF